MLALLIAGLLAAAPTADDAALAAKLVGAWRLVRYEDKPAKGPSQFPYGERPAGLVIYDASGQMSLQIMKRPHPKVASGIEEHVAPAEKQALFDAYIAYFGTYAVDAKRGRSPSTATGCSSRRSGIWTARPGRACACSSGSRHRTHD